MNKTAIAAVAAGMLLVTSSAAIAGYSFNKPEVSTLLPVTLPADPVSVSAEPIFPVAFDTEMATPVHPFCEELTFSIPAQMAETEDEEENQPKSYKSNCNIYDGEWRSTGIDLCIISSDKYHAKLYFRRVDEPYKNTGFIMDAEYDEATKTYYYSELTKIEVWFSKEGKVASEKETKVESEGEVWFWKDYCIWNDESEPVKDHLFRFGRKPSDRPVENIDLIKIKQEREKVLEALEKEAQENQ